MTTLMGAQKSILLAINKLEGADRSSVDAAKIAELTKIHLPDVRNWLDTLQDAGYLSGFSTSVGYSVQLAPSGRLALSNEEQIAGPRPSSASNSGRRYRVVAFDLDGTLIRSKDPNLTFIYSWKLVWDYLKYPEELHRSGMHAYLKKKKTYREWCEWAVQLFRDQGLKRSDFRDIVAPLRLTNNLYPTFKTLKRYGMKLYLISGGIDTFLEEMIPDAGNWFDRIYINRLKFDDNSVIVGVDSTEYDFEGKATALDLVCEENGCGVEESVFVGEGFNDLDVARRAGLTIAYPPRAAILGDTAEFKVVEDDLSEILPYIIN